MGDSGEVISGQSIVCMCVCVCVGGIGAGNRGQWVEGSYYRMI
jgi:hypothetical protein